MRDQTEINIESLLESISSWEDWYRIEEELFDIGNWPYLPHEKVDALLSREVKEIDGIKWEATCTHYAIDREFEYKYEKLRDLVFEKMEPQAAKENMKHPDQYGKLCVICSIWTRDINVESCSVCNHDLVLFPLNED